MTAQELGDRRIFSAPLVIKPDLEDIQDGEDSPEPSFLGWIDVTTILQAFIKGDSSFWTTWEAKQDY